MKAEWVNPFTEAAFLVIGQVVGGEARRGEIRGQEDPVITSGVATVIGVTGALAGHVVYDMDRKTAIEIASVMNGEPMPGISNMVRSTINELSNMITGNAAAGLAEAGFSCQITPPTFILGDSSEVYAFQGARHLVVPIETRCGKVTLSIALEERG